GGAAMVNDISAGDDDPKMLSTMAALQVPYIMMHKRGSPQTMQQLTQYENVTKAVFDYFVAKTGEAKQWHIHDIIFDPGFGFAKTTEQNYQLLGELEVFKILEKPILVGLSRKKMIQHVIEEEASNALNGTSVAHTLALLKGANILRVHDVKEAIECIKIVAMMN
ncbi:MAG: dihydropteroate synthase, partial [Bacteroidetes bacterium]|nr:dihydropteroate synthase [Bacteroidota bacterium]